MSTAFKRIEKSLKEAIAFAKGKNVQARVSVYAPFKIDIKQIRQNLGMSQPQFAAAFGIGLRTLRNWENGERAPKGVALILFKILAKEPQTVMRVLQKESGETKGKASRAQRRRVDPQEVTP